MAKASEPDGRLPPWEERSWTLFVDDKCDQLVDHMRTIVTDDVVAIVDVSMLGRPLPPFLKFVPTLLRRSTQQIVVGNHIPPFLARLQHFEAKQPFKPAKLQTGSRGGFSRGGMMAARTTLPWSVAREQERAQARLGGGTRKKINASTLREMIQDEAARQDTLFRAFKQPKPTGSGVMT